MNELNQLTHLNQLNNILGSITDQQVVEIIKEISTMRESGILPGGVLRDLSIEIYDKIEIPMMSARNIVETHVMLNAAKKWVESQTSQWYPNDSGGWKEYTKTDGSYPDDVHSEMQVEVLLQTERAKQFYAKSVYLARHWDWSDKSDDDAIVAYKVVK